MKAFISLSEKETNIGNIQDTAFYPAESVKPERKTVA